MSQRAVDFVLMWISANVHPKDFVCERRDSKSREYAAECLKHAVAVGISPAEMKKSFDNLEIVMASAIQKSVDQESKWPVHKDG